MTVIKKNVIANYFGQIWTALMGLAFVPLYIRYLGMEAYGLVGLFVMLQAWLTLLDMGMAPTLSREMARFGGGSRSAASIRDLLRSIELIAVVIAGGIALGIWAASHWLATDWLQAEKLPVAQVARAFAIMGIVAALRFIENIYRSSIIGLQRQVLLNTVTSIMATFRGLGALAVLAWLSPTIEAFFLWQCLISISTLGVLIVAVYHALPATSRSARFSWTALVGIWGFAAGMIAITFLSLLLTQVDKILLSRLLPLEAFGYYALATTVANALYRLVQPITQAFYPRFTELVSRDDQTALISTYHRGAQLVTVLTGSAAVILVFLGDVVLRLWTGDAALAQRLAPLVALLATGVLLNCLMHIPYQLQLAHGWTGLTVRINIVAVLILVPAILWVTPRYGAIGTASVWLILNTGYVTIGIYLMHRRLIPDQKWCWYRQDLGLPLLLAAGTALLLRQILPTEAGTWGRLASVLITGGLVLLVASLAAPVTRRQITRLMPARIKALYPRVA